MFSPLSRLPFLSLSPMDKKFTSRLASEADISSIGSLMTLAIENLQTGFLSPSQVVASRSIMGLDTQLIQDGSYFVVEQNGVLAGCGGWSRRKTLYGGDQATSLRDPGLLDPAHDAARVRAMYTHPSFARQGVARLILDLCERTAAAQGFASTELMSTMSGQPLYAAAGYHVLESVYSDVAGVKVPLVRMGKVLELSV